MFVQGNALYTSRQAQAHTDPVTPKPVAVQPIVEPPKPPPPPEPIKPVPVAPKLVVVPKPIIKPKPVTPKPVVASGACIDAMKLSFPESQWQNATLVMQKESGLRPGAISPTNDHGCFQINKMHFGSKGWTAFNDIYNAEFNARIAYAMYKTQGWQPWSASVGSIK